MQTQRTPLRTTVIAAAALRVCRQGIPHKPMTLGGDVAATEQVKRIALGPMTNLMERSL